MRLLLFHIPRAERLFFYAHFKEVTLNPKSKNTAEIHNRLCKATCRTDKVCSAYFCILQAENSVVISYKTAYSGYDEFFILISDMKFFAICYRISDTKTQFIAYYDKKHHIRRA